MQKWEYLELHTYPYHYDPKKVSSRSRDFMPGTLWVKADQLDDVMAILGSEGWELVAVYSAARYFKRPVPNL